MERISSRTKLAVAAVLTWAACLIAATALVPETAWAQTVQFENGREATLNDNGTIVGSCSTVVYFVPLSMDDVDHFDVFMPDGQIVRGDCIDHGRVAPINGTYGFVATPTGSDSYSVLVDSGNAGYGVSIDGTTVPANATQRVGYITWTPRIVRKGGISLTKRSSSPAITDGNGCYSLEGAAYGVFDTYDAAQAGKEGSALATYETDANGVWSSGQDYRAGTYYVAELSAPAGYVRDKSVYAVDVQAGEVTSVNAPGGGVLDAPQTNPVTLWARKGDAAMPEGKAQGAGTLEGAQFTVRYYDGFYDAESLPPAPERTWVVATDADGKAPVDDAHKVSGDDFYRTADGQITLPLGTVTIEETQAPRGYLPDAGGLRVVRITPGGTAETVDVYRPQSFSDDIARGGVAVGKIDRQTGWYAPQGCATLEGARFDIVTENDQPVLVDGTAYAKGSVVASIEAQFDGSAFCASTDLDTLPFGTYTVRECESSPGYLYDDESRNWSRSFAIESDGQVVDLTDPGNAAANQVVRGDFAFSKIDWFSATRLSGVPFLVTSLTTGEAHVIVTDENGMVSTAASWNAHSTRTNANDAALSNGEAGAAIDEAALDPSAGVWFDGRTDAPCNVDDGLGALPFDTYRITELRAPGNEGFELATFDVCVTRDGVELDLGTVDDNAGPIVATSLSDGNGVKLAPAGEPALVTDTVGYANLDIREQYMMAGTLHLVNDDGTDGGIVAEGATTFQPTASSGLVEVDFVVDTSNLEGARLVAFEQVIDAEGTVQASHEDLTYEGQTVRVPSIATSIADSADGDGEVSAEGIVTLVDTVSYRGLTPGDAYTLAGTLHLRNDDGSDGGVALDEQGREITARQRFIAEDSEGSVEVTFTFEAPSLAGKTAVAFEELERKDRVYAVHADIADEGQTIEFAPPTPEEPTPETPPTPEKPEPETPAVEVPEQPSKDKPQDEKPAPSKPSKIAKTGDAVMLNVFMVLIPAAAIGLAGAALAVRKLERDIPITLERGKPKR